MKNEIKIALNKCGLLPAAMYLYRSYYYARHKRCEIGGKLRASGKVDEKYRKMMDYKNIHNGQRCFIVATGPSLKVEDVEKLTGEHTFSMNSIVKMFDKTSWRPTYYGIQDERVYSVLCNDKYFSDMKNIFVADYVFEKLGIDMTNSGDYIIYPFDLLDHYYYKRTTFRTKFSDNAYDCVYDGGTVTYSMMQIAAYMGFKEIYLLGCDCDYSGEKKHFKDYG